MSDIIKTAERADKRRFNKVFNNELRKYVAEIVTNSDDSYKRMESRGELDPTAISPVYITIDKTLREVTIVDNAEGMDFEDLGKNFSVYGADTSGGGTGQKVRGLFGQGATDVMLNASLNGMHAEINSIKNDEFYTCKFKWEGGDKRIQRNQSKISKSQLRGLRERYNIPNNGTIVHFGLPELVRIPHDMEDNIRTCYMLRFILNKANRRVVLIAKTSGKQRELDLQYVFPDQTAELLLADTDVAFDYEGQSVTGSLKISRKPADAEQFGDLRLLCYDGEESVYDNTLFGYEKNPGAEILHGTLKLTGASEIIRAKLNQKVPEELLTETRDGFQRGHAFYKSLVAEVEPHIIEALRQVNSERKGKEVLLSEQKEWSAAFREINRYFKDELEEEIGGVDTGIDAPSDGLRFLYPSIKITAGKRYSLKLLINVSLVPIGSIITLAYESGDIELTPAEFTVMPSDIIQDNLAAKAITIHGIEPTNELLAIAEASTSHSAKLFVQVIDSDIHYPKYGLEFWPTAMVAKLNHESRGRLYFDTAKHPIGSSVKLTSSSSDIILTDDTIMLESGHMISESIGVVECHFTGLVTNTSARITAKVDSASSELLVTIKESDQPPAGSGGFLSGVSIIEADMFWQTFYNRRDGQIKINSSNIINQLHLGAIDPANPKFSKEHHKYLAELCATESAKQLVRLKIEKGKIPDTDYESVMDDIQRSKNTLLSIFIQSIERLID